MLFNKENGKNINKSCLMSFLNTAESLAQRKEIQCTVKLPLATTLYKATIYPKHQTFPRQIPIINHNLL